MKSNGSPGQASGWSSDHESDSDDSLQPFDLAEEEDDGEQNHVTSWALTTALALGCDATLA